VARSAIKTWPGLALACAALAACEPAGVRVSPVPAERPAAIGANAVVPPSANSQALSAYYARVQQNLLTQGLLRVDGGGPDVPFTKRQLVENFVRIALFEEFSNIGGRLVAMQTESRLHRWEEPVRMTVEFGRSVPLEQRVRDRNAVIGYAARLSRITGLRIDQVRNNANFHVFIVNEDERRILGPRLREIVPGISPGAIAAVEDLPRSTFCLVFARDPDNDGAYSDAVAVIRGEHPDLLRLSCIHEELAQGLGLSNDSPAARPSVFNDDEEFGLLTTHDELLLQILYDPRMRTGMSLDQARPTANVIASELMGGES